MGKKSCPNELKFCEVSRNVFKETKKISDFYLDKQKCFIPKKTLSVPCTIDSSTAKRWRLDVLTLSSTALGKLLGL